MPKIDLNTASREDLTRLRGVGPTLADRILLERSRLGGFTTFDELRNVDGVRKSVLDELAVHATVPAKQPTRQPSSQPVVQGGTASGDGSEGAMDGAPVQTVSTSSDSTAHLATRELTSWQLHVLLVAASGDHRGYRVSLNGRRAEEQAVLPFATSATVEADSVVDLQLPNRSVLVGNVTIDVLLPDGSLVNRLELLGSSLPERLEINVAARVAELTQPNLDPAAGLPTRIRGRLADARGAKVGAGIQVVLWAASTKSPAEQDYAALVVAETDAQGHFSGPYPTAVYTAGHATITSASAEPVTVPVHLEEGRFPERLLLVAELPARPELIVEDDCECHGPSDQPPRLPDATDLARADGTFSSDGGAGRCVDFTKPDRTLEEYSFSYVVRTTEPDIRGFTLDEPTKVPLGRVRGLAGLSAFGFEAATSASSGADAGTQVRSLRLPGGFGGGGSSGGDVDETDLDKVDVDAQVLKTLARDPDGFSLTTLVDSAKLSAHADVMRALGRLVVRTPGRTVLTGDNTVDWDDDPTVYQACTVAHGHILRFKQEWVADGYSMGTLLYSLPLAPGQKKQMAVLDWERRESASRSERADSTERLDAFVDRDRDISDIVNATVSESLRGGSSSSSGGIGAGLGVGGFFGGIGGMLGVGGGYSSASSDSWQNSSRDTAANALNSLRDRTVQSASAVRSQRTSVVQTVTQGERVTTTTESVANYNHCHALTIQYFEVLRHLLVRQRLTDVQECLFVPLMMSWFTSAKTLRWRSTLERGVPRSLRGGFAAVDRISHQYAGSDLPTGRYCDEQVLTVDGDLRLRFQLTRPKDKDDGSFDASEWSPLQLLFGFDPFDIWHRHVQSSAEKDRAFQRVVGPQIARAVVDRLQFRALTHSGVDVDLHLDPTLISTYVNDQQLYVTLRPKLDPDAVNRADIKAVVVSAWIEDLLSKLGPYASLANTLPSGSRIVVDAGSMRYTTAHFSGSLFASSSIKNDLTGTDEVRINTPLTREELRNPREEDKELARNLLAHLNEHLEAYHHRIWAYGISDARRYMLLDGFVAPNSGGRSVASVVDNELVGIVGNCLVMPVSRGVHLDPTYDQDKRNPINLLEHYEPNTPIEPTRLALPTRGVYAEAVMGACNSCEVKDETRFWRWEESPIPDSPTPILPISTETRRADPGDLTAKDYPAPIIAMQTAPAAPDPTGLAGALALLGQPNLFRDAAGLEGTQKNAAAALEQALSTATTFGTKAADLALQGKMSRDVDKAMRTISTARNQGLIDDAQASALTEQAIRGLVGAGATNPPAATTNADVESLTRTAGEHQAAVRVDRPTGERVEVDARSATGNGTGEEGGVLDSLANLFGLGNDTGPRTRPVVATDRTAALALIAAFRARTTPTVWTGLGRTEVADRLVELVNDADKINQGSIGVCGAAVFFNVWIANDP